MPCALEADVLTAGSECLRKRHESPSIFVWSHGRTLSSCAPPASGVRGMAIARQPVQSGHGRRIAVFAAENPVLGFASRLGCRRRRIDGLAGPVGQCMGAGRGRRRRRAAIRTSGGRRSTPAAGGDVAVNRYVVLRRATWQRMVAWFHGWRQVTSRHLEASAGMEEVASEMA